MAQQHTEFNMTCMTFSATSLVEKCLAKLANEVTEQVRDKLIDILIAVLARECEDFDGESVRRLLVAELETTPLTFAVEKRAGPAKTKTLKEAKEKTPKEKKVRAPKEKAPKAPKAVVSVEEREARKAAKQAEREAEKEARKAAKQAEREAAKEATKAAKETGKDADKEAVKAAKKAEKAVERAAKLAEREAAKTARKAEKDAEREAAKAAKQAEKEAAAAAAPIVVAPKEQRLPIPWCGARIEGRCEALRVYHGLFAQCTSDATEISAFCPSCEKSNALFGTCAMRAACGLFDYTDPKGKKCLRLANVVEKFGVEGGLDAFIAEAAKHSITLPAEHLTKEVKQRGRPKSSSSSPRASSKVATSDTGSETETDDEEHQQKRKQVSKVAASEAPKKRGRPAKNPKSDVTPSDEVIQDLVASAAAISISSAPSTPVAVTPKSSSPAVVETPAAPKKAKAVALKAKPAQRKTRVIEEQTFWVDSFNGVEILIRQEDNATFEASNGEPLGFWDDKTKTIIECDDEDEE
jgi:hypothetical protein